MTKFLSVAVWTTLIVWYMNFDAEAYVERKERLQADALGKEPVAEAVKADSDGTLIFPLKGLSLADVISGYGDERDGGSRVHEGIDVPAERGTPVLAVADGVITKVGDRNNAGKQVWLQVGDRQFFYAHLDSWTVEEGQEVKQGDVIGTVGNTGNARHTSPHLHLGVYTGRRETIDPSGLFVQE